MFSPSTIVREDTDDEVICLRNELVVPGCFFLLWLSYVCPHCDEVSRTFSGKNESVVFMFCAR